jgi:hypothetical protein
MFAGIYSANFMNDPLYPNPGFLKQTKLPLSLEYHYIIVKNGMEFPQPVAFNSLYLLTYLRLSTNERSQHG